MLHFPPSLSFPAVSNKFFRYRQPPCCFSISSLFSYLHCIPFFWKSKASTPSSHFMHVSTHPFPFIPYRVSTDNRTIPCTSQIFNLRAKKFYLKKGWRISGILRYYCCHYSICYATIVTCLSYPQHDPVL